MRQVLFIQGGGEGTYEDWDNQAASIASGRRSASGYEVRYPRMPERIRPQLRAMETSNRKRVRRA